ncbi:MAG: Ig-like domain-containing protein, partial [Deltaproteobacteria bacterium]|nr:Ig-like domain-containing protein [Deltaproteobacteria bacterium]
MTPKNLLFTSLLLTTTLIACGNGSDVGGDGTGGVGGGGGIRVPLQVVETDPVDMATDVSPDTEVRATFNNAVQETTASTTSFSVRRSDGREVTGAVTVTSDGSSALFVPDGALELRTAYTATVTTGIESLDGSSLEADYAWVFTTRGDGDWGTAERIDADDAGVAPEVAVDASGNVVAVWSSASGYVWSNRWTPSGGWGTAERIETDGPGSDWSARVAVGANGDAVAVWIRGDWTGGDLPTHNVWSNHWTPSGGWGTAEHIAAEDAGDTVWTPTGGAEVQVAVDASGNAVAVWSQSDGTRYNIWSNRLTPSGGWGTAERIELDDVGSAYGPKVAVDASGNVVAVWMHSVDTVGIATAGAIHYVWSNRWTSSGGWGTAEPIETNGADEYGFSQMAQVAVDVSGNAVAVWPQWDGTRHDVWSNRWTTSGGWGTAERIETDDTGSANQPKVAIDAIGNAVTVWYQWDGTRSSISSSSGST